MPTPLRALLLMALLATPSWAQDEGQEPPPFARTRLEPSTTVTVGQPVTVVVEVLVPTWFTAAPWFPTLDVDDAIAVFEPRGTNFSERTDGRTWAGQARKYLVYPQRAGRFEIDEIPIDIRYTSKAGGSRTRVTVSPPPLSFDAVVPPEAAGLPYFIASSELTFEQTFDRETASLKGRRRLHPNDHDHPRRRARDGAPTATGRRPDRKSGRRLGAVSRPRGGSRRRRRAWGGDRRDAGRRDDLRCRASRRVPFAADRDSLVERRFGDARNEPLGGRRPRGRARSGENGHDIAGPRRGGRRTNDGRSVARRACSPLAARGGPRSGRFHSRPWAVSPPPWSGRKLACRKAPTPRRIVPGFLRSLPSRGAVRRCARNLERVVLVARSNPPRFGRRHSARVRRRLFRWRPVGTGRPARSRIVHERWALPLWLVWTPVVCECRKSPAP